MKILLVGHAISPRRGSEHGNTWNWARVLALSHDVWVIAHPEFREEVEDELRRKPQPSMHLSWVDLPRRLDLWQLSAGRTGFPLHYLVWQEMVFRRARAMHANISFDYVQHVSIATISAPPKLWRLGIPFIWGPIGGGQTSPSSFLKYFRRERISELARTARVRMLHLSPALRLAAQNSALIMATNCETMELLRRAGAANLQPFLDCGLPSEYVSARPIVRPATTGITLIWVARFLARKGFPLALEALAQTDQTIRLIVVGDGGKREEYQKLGASLGVGDRVRFLGSLSWDRLSDAFDDADGFLFTSIRDSAGCAVLQAMAHALPVIALNHQGVAAHFPDNATIKVPVTSPGEVIANIAAAMRQLNESPELRQRLGEAAWRFASTQVWENRIPLAWSMINRIAFRNDKGVMGRGSSGS
ncbi:MAG TPA: glycosyltransferase family 4 protein [Acidobacteriaceae bacterium]|nr:glycosyltransferase family 4 protein [Acidobacteriaceae bacterium]